MSHQRGVRSAKQLSEDKKGISLELEGGIEIYHYIILKLLLKMEEIDTKTQERAAGYLKIKPQS